MRMPRFIRNAWEWFDDRAGLSQMLGPMLSHIVPRDARWWYVFGSATLCCFALQVATGIGLSFAYAPSSGNAYQSLLYITNDAFLGHLLRGMHFYGASAMIGLVVIHFTQVFLHAAFKYPRELNWMSGVLLLFFTLGMGFTGQILRWDSNAVWSVVVGAEQADRVPWIGPTLAHFILGGETMGGDTLSRFYAIHVFLLPGAIFAFVGLHLALVLRHGISEMPKTGQPVEPRTYKQEYEQRLHKNGVPFFPYAAWRDIVFATLVVGVIIALALLLGPPALGKAPNPADVTTNPAPDWYLRWYFAILAMLPPWLESYVIVGVPLVIFAVLLVTPLLSNRGERAPTRRPWAIVVVGAGAVLLVVLTILGYREPWSPRFNAPALPQSVIGATSGPVARGGDLVHTKGCLYCHEISGIGGLRGPHLTYVGDRLTKQQMIIRITNGGHNMPSFAGSLTAEELKDIVAFLQTRRRHPENSGGRTSPEPHVTGESLDGSGG